MDLKKLLGMRPKTESIADIEAALAAASAAGEAAAKAEAELLAKRGAVLLSGTPDEVTRAEEALGRARMEADHAATMVPILEAKLAEAERRPLLEEVRAGLAEAERIWQAFDQFVANEYPDLARKIAAGMAMEVKRKRLLEHLRTRRHVLTIEELEVLKFPSDPTFFQNQVGQFGELVKLPDPTFNGGYIKSFWPPQA